MSRSPHRAMSAACRTFATCLVVGGVVGCAEEPVENSGPGSPTPSTSRLEIETRGTDDPLVNDRRKPAARKKIALLVGIRDYAPGTEFEQLHGPINDVRLVHHTLVEHFGFEPENIKCLTDAEATHEQIVTWFQRWLIEGSDADTQAVFWFSGHGSRVKDQSQNGELDGYDSTLLAYDSRAGDRNGEHDIVDDALHALIHACPSRWMTVVTDACHSGSVTRGTHPPTRKFVKEGTETAKLPSFWPEKIKVLEDDDPLRGELKSNYVHIGACLDHQSAAEYTPEGDATHGALTWFLTRAMRRAQPGDTYDKVAAKARLVISASAPNPQSVTIEGVSHRPLFNDQFTRSSGYRVTIETSRGEERLRIHAGELMGVLSGTVLDVRSLRTDETIGEAEVRQSHMLHAFATWRGARRSGREPGGVEAGDQLSCQVRTTPRRAAALRTLVVDESLRDRVAEIPLFEVVTDTAAQFSYTLHRDDTTEKLVLRTREGHEIFASSGERAPDSGRRSELEECARFESRFQELWRLATPGENGEEFVAIDFVAPNASDFRAAPTLKKDAKVEPDPKSPDGVFRCELDSSYAESESEGFLAVLEIVSDERKAVTVLSLSEARFVNQKRSTSIAIVHPRRDSADVFVEGTRRIPIWVGTTPEWKLDRPVQERYLVIVTDDPVDFYPMVDDLTGADTQPAQTQPAQTRSGSASPGKTLVSDKIPEVLRELFVAPKTRAVADPKNDSASWGALAVDLFVSRKNKKEKEGK